MCTQTSYSPLNVQAIVINQKFKIKQKAPFLQL